MAKKKPISVTAPSISRPQETIPETEIEVIAPTSTPIDSTTSITPAQQLRLNEISNQISTQESEISLFQSEYDTLTARELESLSSTETARLDELEALIPSRQTETTVFQTELTTLRESTVLSASQQTRLNELEALIPSRQTETTVFQTELTTLRESTVLSASQQTRLNELEALIPSRQTETAVFQTELTTLRETNVLSASQQTRLNELEALIPSRQTETTVFQTELTTLRESTVLSASQQTRLNELEALIPSRQTETTVFQTELTTLRESTVLSASQQTRLNELEALIPSRQTETATLQTEINVLNTQGLQGADLERYNEIGAPIIARTMLRLERRDLRDIENRTPEQNARILAIRPLEVVLNAEVSALQNNSSLYNEYRALLNRHYNRGKRDRHARISYQIPSRQTETAVFQTELTTLRESTVLSASQQTRLNELEALIPSRQTETTVFQTELTTLRESTVLSASQQTRLNELEALIPSRQTETAVFQTELTTLRESTVLSASQQTRLNELEALIPSRQTETTVFQTELTTLRESTVLSASQQTRLNELKALIPSRQTETAVFQTELTTLRESNVLSASQQTRLNELEALIPSRQTETTVFQTELNTLNDRSFSDADQSRLAFLPKKISSVNSSIFDLKNKKNIIISYTKPLPFTVSAPTSTPISSTTSITPAQQLRLNEISNQISTQESEISLFQSEYDTLTARELESLSSTETARLDELEALIPSRQTETATLQNELTSLNDRGLQGADLDRFNELHAPTILYDTLSAEQTTLENIGDRTPIQEARLLAIPALINAANDDYFNLIFDPVLGIEYANLYYRQLSVTDQNRQTELGTLIPSRQAQTTVFQTELNTLNDRSFSDADQSRLAFLPNKISSVNSSIFDLRNEKKIISFQKPLPFSVSAPQKSKQNISTNKSIPFSVSASTPSPIVSPKLTTTITPAQQTRLDEISSLISSQQSEISLFQSEYDTLSSQQRESLSPTETARLDELLTLISTRQSETANIQTNLDELNSRSLQGTELERFNEINAPIAIRASLSAELVELSNMGNRTPEQDARFYALPDLLNDARTDFIALIRNRPLYNELRELQGRHLNAAEQLEQTTFTNQISTRQAQTTVFQTELTSLNDRHFSPTDQSRVRFLSDKITSANSSIINFRNEADSISPTFILSAKQHKTKKSPPKKSKSIALFTFNPQSNNTPNPQSGKNAELLAQYNMQLSEYNTLFATHNQKLKEFETDSAEHINLLAEHETSSLEYNTALSEYNTLFADHQTQLEEFETSSLAHQTQLAEYNTLFADHQTQLAEHETNSEEYINQLAEYNTLLTDHNTQLAEHETNTTLYNSQLAEYNTLLTDHNTQLAEHETNLALHETSLAEYNTLFAEHQTQLAEHQTSLAEYNTLLTEHETQLALHETNLALHETNLAEHETSLAEYETNSATFDEQIALVKQTNLEYLIEFEAPLRHLRELELADRVTEDLARWEAGGRPYTLRVALSRPTPNTGWEYVSERRIRVGAGRLVVEFTYRKPAIPIATGELLSTRQDEDSLFSSLITPVNQHNTEQARIEAEQHTARLLEIAARKLEIKTPYDNQIFDKIARRNAGTWNAANPSRPLRTWTDHLGVVRTTGQMIQSQVRVINRQIRVLTTDRNNALEIYNFTNLNLPNLGGTWYRRWWKLAQNNNAPTSLLAAYNLEVARRTTQAQRARQLSIDRAAASRVEFNSQFYGSDSTHARISALSHLPALSSTQQTELTTLRASYIVGNFQLQRDRNDALFRQDADQINLLFGTNIPQVVPGRPNQRPAVIIFSFTDWTGEEITLNLALHPGDAPISPILGSLTHPGSAPTSPNLGSLTHPGSAPTSPNLGSLTHPGSAPTSPNLGSLTHPGSAPTSPNLGSLTHPGSAPTSPNLDSLTHPGSAPTSPNLDSLTHPGSAPVKPSTPILHQLLPAKFTLLAPPPPKFTLLTPTLDPSLKASSPVAPSLIQSELNTILKQKANDDVFFGKIKFKTITEFERLATLGRISGLHKKISASEYVLSRLKQAKPTYNYINNQKIQKRKITSSPYQQYYANLRMLGGLENKLRADDISNDFISLQKLLDKNLSFAKSIGFTFTQDAKELVHYGVILSEEQREYNQKLARGSYALDVLTEFEQSYKSTTAPQKPILEGVLVDQGIDLKAQVIILQDKKEKIITVEQLVKSFQASTFETQKRLDLKKAVFFGPFQPPENRITDKTTGEFYDYKTKEYDLTENSKLAESLGVTFDHSDILYIPGSLEHIYQTQEPQPPQPPQYRIPGPTNPETWDKYKKITETPTQEYKVPQFPGQNPEFINVEVLTQEQKNQNLDGILPQLETLGREYAEFALSFYRYTVPNISYNLLFPNPELDKILDKKYRELVGLTPDTEPTILPKTINQLIAGEKLTGTSYGPTSDRVTVALEIASIWTPAGISKLKNIKYLQTVKDQAIKSNVYKQINSKYSSSKESFAALKLKFKVKFGIQGKPVIDPITNKIYPNIKLQKPLSFNDMNYVSKKSIESNFATQKVKLGKSKVSAPLPEVKWHAPLPFDHTRWDVPRRLFSKEHFNSKAPSKTLDHQLKESRLGNFPPNFDQGRGAPIIKRLISKPKPKVELDSYLDNMPSKRSTMIKPDLPEGIPTPPGTPTRSSFVKQNVKLGKSKVSAPLPEIKWRGPLPFDHTRWDVPRRLFSKEHSNSAQPITTLKHQTPYSRLGNFPPNFDFGRGAPRLNTIKPKPKPKVEFDSYLDNIPSKRSIYNKPTLPEGIPTPPGTPTRSSFVKQNVKLGKSKVSAPLPEIKWRGPLPFDHTRWDVPRRLFSKEHSNSAQPITTLKHQTPYSRLGNFPPNFDFGRGAPRLNTIKPKPKPKVEFDSYLDNIPSKRSIYNKPTLPEGIPTPPGTPTRSSFVKQNVKLGKSKVSAPLPEIKWRGPLPFDHTRWDVPRRLFSKEHSNSAQPITTLKHQTPYSRLGNFPPNFDFGRGAPRLNTIKPKPKPKVEFDSYLDNIPSKRSKHNKPDLPEGIPDDSMQFTMKDIDMSKGSRLIKIKEPSIKPLTQGIPPISHNWVNWDVPRRLYSGKHSHSKAPFNIIWKQPLELKLGDFPKNFDFGKGAPRLNTIKPTPKPKVEFDSYLDNIPSKRSKHNKPILPKGIDDELARHNIKDDDLSEGLLLRKNLYDEWLKNQKKAKGPLDNFENEFKINQRTKQPTKKKSKKEEEKKDDISKETKSESNQTTIQIHKEKPPKSKHQSKDTPPEPPEPNPIISPIVSPHKLKPKPSKTYLNPGVLAHISNSESSNISYEESTQINLDDNVSPVPSLDVSELKITPKKPITEHPGQSLDVSELKITPKKIITQSPGQSLDVSEEQLIQHLPISTPVITQKYYTSTKITPKLTFTPKQITPQPAKAPPPKSKFDISFAPKIYIPKLTVPIILTPPPTKTTRTPKPPFIPKIDVAKKRQNHFSSNRDSIDFLAPIPLDRVVGIYKGKGIIYGVKKIEKEQKRRAKVSPRFSTKPEVKTSLRGTPLEEIKKQKRRKKKKPKKEDKYKVPKKSKRNYFGF